MHASFLLIAATLASPSALPADECSSSKKAAETVAHRPGNDIVTTAIEAGEFKTLAAALTAAGLVETLQGKGPFTVFAPTDAAFAALPKGTVEGLLEPKNLSTLKSILTYHVVSGSVPAKQVIELDFASTVNGQRVDVKVDEGTVMIDGATVTMTDIKCSNGIIHVIDSVLMPATKNIVETAVEAGSFKTLAAALGAADLAETLSGKGPFTVFAPTDAAFAKLPAGTLESLLKPENKERLIAILKYHVVSGQVYSDQARKVHEANTLQGSAIRPQLKDGSLLINDSKVITADIETTNGVIHVIDTVLLPS